MVAAEYNAGDGEFAHVGGKNDDDGCVGEWRLPRELLAAVLDSRTYGFSDHPSHHPPFKNRRLDELACLPVIKVSS